MLEKNGSKVVRFGNFEFDLYSRELRKFGVRLRLEDKPAQLLCWLVENAPTLLTRAELNGRLWPEGVYLDRNHGLNKSINRLRLVLGDDPAKPRFIETLSRRGYRFVAEVEALGAACNSRVATGSQVSHDLSDNGKSGNRAAQPANVAEDEAPSHRLWHGSRRVVMFGLGAVLLLALAAVLLGQCLENPRRFGFVGRSQPRISSLVIETGGGFDPPDGGFQPHVIGTVHTKPLRNRASGGVDRLQVTSDDQAYFFRSLTETEKDFVLGKDWKLTCVCAVVRGGAHANIDFGRDRGVPRFDIELLQEADRYYVALTSQISPEAVWEKKIEFAGAGDVAHPHTYELHYDHRTHTASLWIDGDLQVSDYHGVQQFRENRGVMFGASTYQDSIGATGVFRAVRFEAR